MAGLPDVIPLFMASRRKTLLIPLALLAAAMIASVLNLRREVQVVQLDALLKRQTFVIATDGGALPDARILHEHGLNARAQVQCALLLARYAQAAGPSAARDDALGQAGASVDAALASRPRWGEARTVRAYIDVLCRCAPAEETRRQIAQSYVDAPYLRYAGDWRIAFSLRNWSALPPATRSAVIDEGIWLTRVNYETRDPIFALFRASPAYEEFLLRWRRIRLRDPDLNGGAATRP